MVITEREREREGVTQGRARTHTHTHTRHRIDLTHSRTAQHRGRREFRPWTVRLALVAFHSFPPLSPLQAEGTKLFIRRQSQVAQPTPPLYK